MTKQIILGLSVMAGIANAKPPDNMQLFLLIGQSNMAGRGKVTPADRVTHPRIFMLDKANTWVPARDPLHFDKPGMAGVGLGSEFARQAAARDTETVIGLIPCAFGGTSMDQWSPGKSLYTTAVARARAAMANGRLAGILWHQGEADSAPEKVATYPARFAAMIARLREDLDAAAVPVIVGELGHFRPSFPPFNAMLPQIAAAVPRCALVSAENLGHGGDSLHFSAEALREFGVRYYEVFTALVSGRDPDGVEKTSTIKGGTDAD